MDCNQIRKVAANALITCNIHSFPIDCFAILKQYGFRVYSYLELQKKKPELYNLCISYSQDAFCINSLNLIAYNSQKSANRIRFSLMHELGHHLLRHRKDLPSNEDEANYFASNILAPRIAMYYAHLKSVNEVGQFFNLSSSAAYYAAQDFSEWCQDVRRNGMHSYDKDLYQHFYNPDYKGFVYSIRTCAFCGARVYNCLDFEAHCSGACKLPDEPVRKKRMLLHHFQMTIAGYSGGLRINGYMIFNIKKTCHW